MKINAFSTSIYLVISLVLTGCSSFGTNTKASLSASVHKIKFTSPSNEQRVIIYNNGITRPQEREICRASYNQPPPSLLALRSAKTLIYPVCSTATEAMAISAAGKQVYLRKKEINHVIDAFLERGILPKNLFLAGHSNGAWTSLMMMHDVNKRFNGLIGFAPAFAGKRSEASLFPWWRDRVRPAQIKDMLGAAAIDALIFAYENDAYNRPQELQFLVDNYPLKQSINGVTGVQMIAYNCGLRRPHQTYRKDCKQAATIKYMRNFIDQQISRWRP